ncbi:MAG: M3 family metallopeptidase [Muribaculaceae bacterium]|nr:M3 family metallopeptidase [Muribaculaceae bacterium]
MKAKTLAVSALTLCGALIQPTMSHAAERVNPFTVPYETPFGIPPYESITADDYMPALKQAIDYQRKAIADIVANKETPTFDNTVLALEQSGDDLAKVAGVFFSLTEALNTPEIAKISEEFIPMISAWEDEMTMNPGLFKRIKYLYDNLDKLGLDTARRRAVEQLYKDFSRNGALLSDADQQRLKDINMKMADLELKYNKNLLDATNAFELVVKDPAKLSGIPESVVANAADEAKTRGYGDGTWVFTLHAPSRLPVLQFANDRGVREEMFRGYTSLASNGQYDNNAIIAEMLPLRAEKAKLLGFKDFAAYQTDNVMAKTPEAAESLTMQVYIPAVKRVHEEVAEMQAIADAEKAGITIEPWDYYYYAEKVRKQKYAFDEEKVKEYFTADNLPKGLFAMANRLYGLTFREITDAPKYHPDVKVYEVLDRDGKHLSIWMSDYYARSTKRQGAWMEAQRGAYVDPDGTSVRPIVYNVANFSKPSGDIPSLLSIDDVQTAFHEFGHALHGMLTRAELRSQAGTNVDRDFVEMHSQIHEHWAFEPELLREYAFHYRTGEVIPDSLVAKINAASQHNAGFNTVERLAASLLDLEFGHLNPVPGEVVDIPAFELQVKEKIGMPKEIEYRYRSPYFKHIFGSTQYACGYYTYLWAEVLEADAFDMFLQNGIFDRATADAYLHNLLEPGGSEDPMKLFIKFRGQEPSPKPLLRKLGLDGK